MNDLHKHDAGDNDHLFMGTKFMSIVSSPEVLLK